MTGHSDCLNGLTDNIDCTFAQRYLLSHFIVSQIKIVLSAQFCCQGPLTLWIVFKPDVGLLTPVYTSTASGADILIFVQSTAT